MLWLIARVRAPAVERLPLDWLSAAMLFAYAVAFSFAYLSLSVGTGALILFGAVQLTMFFAGLRAGEHFAPLAWAGLLIALSGLVYLVWPGVTAPEPAGAVLMAAAGVSWGIYSLRGRGGGDPLRVTARNFLLAVPMGLLTSLLFLADLRADGRGFALAVASGAIASGLGYVIWFAALRGLSATSAATVQLAVPVVAAAGGVLLLAEPVTLRLLVASAVTLGGIGMVVMQRR
jgi:drug/metabolite transporter (DMT)-like permease